jgi:hypothetical protein
MWRPSSGFLIALAAVLLAIALYGSLSYGGCEDYGSACVPIWAG